MSAQTELLRELVARFNAGQPIEVARYFSADFELDAPGTAPWRSGHEGARDMIAAFTPGAQLEILEMIEQGELVAVRYRVTSPSLGAGASIAFYRFVDGRIARDWGVVSPADWRRA